MLMHEKTSVIPLFFNLKVWVFRGIIVIKFFIEGSYHLQLIRSDLDFTLWPAVNTCSLLTYSQDLVSVVVAHCISYAPKVCSHSVDVVVAYSCATDSA